MRKVLISFLGTGPKDRNYKTANYRFSSGNQYETHFVAAAIRQEYKIDKMIMIGTMHSMWECVYDHYAKQNNQFDENICYEIYEQVGDKANHQTEIGEVKHQAEIERQMGGGSKIVTIHYGLNDEEIAKNSETILGLEQYLEQNDELIIDITHGFRSLPLYIMNLIIYLQNVSEKRLKIKHICYGMLDVSQEMGYTPIVEMKDVLMVNKWIAGAYSFKRFGNADQIAELVKELDKGLSKKLDQFSDVKNLNHLAALEQQSKQLRELIRQGNMPQMAKMIITPVVKDFCKQLNVLVDSITPHSDFQYKLACWQYSKDNYLAAYTSLFEAIVTRFCEEECRDGSISYEHCDYKMRQKIQNKYFYTEDEKIKSQVRTWSTLFHKVREVRNALAHNADTELTPAIMIQKLGSFLDRYGELSGLKKKK